MTDAEIVAALRGSVAEKTRRVLTVDPIRLSGTVREVVGLLIESEGPPASLGDVLEIIPESGGRIRAQCVGFRDGRTLSIPLDEVDGLRPGLEAVLRGEATRAPVGEELLGRVLDGFGKPIDGGGAPRTTRTRGIYEAAPGPLERVPIDEPLATGIRVIDGLLPCGKGQRVGLFGGSGVGKSTLLGAMARNSSADVNVIALIGERNREVRGFLEDVLGEDGLKRSVVVTATSEQPAPLRVRAAFLAAAIADDFREQGRDVLLIMDSVTRLATAQREIGLAAGEPPSQKGYPPSVFQLMPRVFERAGRFQKGSVTAFFTVLVEGDDMNEPIADAVRGLLDGHVVLSRELASRNHFPAIDPLESVSRVAREVAPQLQMEDASRLLEAMAAYRRSEDLINLGAYTQGANPKLDSAIQMQDSLNEFLRQDLQRADELPQTLARLHELAGKV